ncbi:hypothetical protein SARC_15956 [Sphaeroforma arctica JP610]|uniref:Uncharacterized protein n=1 Tax=Sphaeroforma arctica JP610 TaxID=667725 RepID=A0A0L0F487_9EUKA|nr:hypothetical protein SARC_15956 [Sphaeroforma arctica JP610]KNC71502.1 hypothetical protein SARC_15956 [Sphaeroforma arctica JP610]|eukprot:XP_014145404.1 hypothetical protein SARC_15956 [Sphaeroforma arctica JP610]
MTDIAASDAALVNERLEIEVSNPKVDVGAHKGGTDVSHIAAEPKKLTKKEQAARRKEEAERCFQKQRALFSEIDKHELHYG